MCSTGLVRVAYHALARRRGDDARWGRANRLAEKGTDASVKIFNCVRGGVDSVAFSVQHDLCNGLQLGWRVSEYSRSRFLGHDSEYPRVEYAQRKSNTLDPDFSETVQNIQEPSMLGGDRVLSIPISRRRFGISKSRVRSTGTEYSRSRDLWRISRKSDSVLVARLRVLGLIPFRAVRPAFIFGRPRTATNKYLKVLSSSPLSKISAKRSPWSVVIVWPSFRDVRVRRTILNADLAVIAGSYSMRFVAHSNAASLLEKMHRYNPSQINLLYFSTYLTRPDHCCYLENFYTYNFTHKILKELKKICEIDT